MWALIGLIVGAAAGSVVGHDWGAALGGLTGFFIGAIFAGARQRASFRKPERVDAGDLATRHAIPADAATALQQRVTALERRVAELERGHPVPPLSVDASAAPALDRSPALAPDGAPGGAPPADASPVQPRAAATAFATATQALWEPGADGTLQPATGDSQAAFERPSAAAPADVTPQAPVVAAPNVAWAWLTGGNALTRIGVVVLFFGVAFLLKYFAEHFTVPIEAKLIAVAIVGVVLIGVGLKTVAARPGYGVSLQGAGGGVLYLTVYAAYNWYDVFPGAVGLALLVAVSALTIWLATRSDSQPLAGLSIAGGFIAPMLTSSQGGPALLFGYFAVLNAAIFALAWVRAWRVLNILGFVFTFVLGMVWGYRYYAPAHFAVVEPFLIGFFVFYVAIAILHAWRGPFAARNPVDGLLVFGVPLVGFALQVALVRDQRYGAAWSALALALGYAALFLKLRRRIAPGFALLARAFLALAVIFVTIAIPLAFDHRATSAMWAVEAAGVYWIGIRQRSMLSRAFALAVQLAAGTVFVRAGAGGADEMLFGNAFFAGALLIAAAALTTAFFADRATEDLPAGERGLVPLVFAWGIAWWIGAGGFELVRRLSDVEASHATLAWVVAGVALAMALRGALRWPRLGAAGIALLPTMAFAAYRDFASARTTLVAVGWLVWPIAWTLQWGVLRVAEALRGDAAPPPLRPAEQTGAAGFLYLMHAVCAAALTAQIAWEASEWMGRATQPDTVWVACAAAWPAVAFLLAAAVLRRNVHWPFADHGEAYAVAAGTPIAALLAVWLVAVNLMSPGDPSPLPYAPVLNPLDVTLALTIVALFFWAQRCSTLSERMRYGALGASLFVSLNGVVLRTAHHWADIPWRLDSLLGSKPLQAALTLTWSATALALMFAAARRGVRPLWMVGAAMLAVVIGKLFLIDLGALSGLPRVVAFLGVGALLLVIGYVSPLPPSAANGTGAERR